MRKIGQIFRFLIPVIALVALVVLMTAAGRRERARLEKNKAIVVRYEEAVWSSRKQNWDVGDEIVPIDHVRHNPHDPEGGLRSREALKQLVTQVFTAIPDFDFTGEFMIAEGDKVASFGTCTGTHTGTAWGIPPTGNEINCIGVYIHRIADGKVVESWALDDSLTLFQQMGFKLVPAGE